MYRWVDHTSELQLDIEAASEEELLADAVAAFGELVGEERGGEPAAHVVEVEGPDRATLLAELLSELVFLAETEDFVPERLAALGLRGATARARVEGRRGAPRQLVKAVTHHRLRFEHDGAAWRGSVVLDV